MEELQSNLLEAFLALVGVLLTLLAAYVRKYVNGKLENETLVTLLNRVADAVEVGVREAANTVVPKLRAASIDGKITAEEAAELREAVKAGIFDQLTKLDRQKLEKLFDRDHLDRKLDQLIEASVQKVKGS